MATYNGHRNYNHWNVSLWINNDERLYRGAQSFVRAARSKTVAAAAFLHSLRSHGETHTPDGAPYSLSSVRAAIRWM